MERADRLPSELIDPDLLPLVAEQRAANALLRARGAGPPPGALDAARLRRFRLYNKDGSFKPRLHPSGVDALLPTDTGEVRIRTFGTGNSGGTVVHFHGGGWVMGSIHEQDELLAAMACATGAAVVSVDYPLAPEHRLPRILEVATAGLTALIRGAAALPLVVVGESAGAHVALQSVLRSPPVVREQISALSLAYGIYDLSMTPSQRVRRSGSPGLSTDWLEWFYAQVLPDQGRDARSAPIHSPLYGGLTVLPPVQLVVGDLDPLLDDSRFLYARCRAAGVAASLCVYPEAPHGFNHQDTMMARRCNGAISSFIRRALAEAAALIAVRRASSTHCPPFVQSSGNR